MSSKIAILGCGWLGFPLAKNLIEKGFKIKGSTTSADKLHKLQEEGIEPFQISISENTIEGDIARLLDNCEIAIINIPPGLRKNPSSNFVAKISLLNQAIKKAKVKNVLFVSSTSVYGDENDVVTEKTQLNPITEGGKQLVESEVLLKTETAYNTTIVRFSGLLGKNRHPIKFLSGKTGLKNGNNPVNLVHLKDCINSLCFIIENELWHDTFNISYPDHPSRESYYTKAAEERKMKLPIFGAVSTTSNNKIISSEKIQTLGFRFKHPI